MSGREWKPGDVAMRVSKLSGKHIALRVKQCPGANLGHLEHWHFVTADLDATQCGSDFSGVADYRPLVTIDPEDREQVEAFAVALRVAAQECSGGVWCNSLTCTHDIARTALREFANPTPPKCPAALNLKGEHFGCDQPEGHGMAHGNKAAGAIWGESE